MTADDDYPGPGRKRPAMFVPGPYRPVSRSSIVELVRDNPLATLVTSHASGQPFATHLPVILERDALCDTGSADVGDLAGTTLLGHMNRVNPHYAVLGQRHPSLLVFTGPHGYVSPVLYDGAAAAPTWNFTAAHVRGEVTVVRGEEETRHIVTSTARLFERRFGRGWDPGSSLEYFEQIPPGVGAFRMSVAVADGMFKLSQDQPAKRRDNVAATSAADGRDLHRDLAELMERSIHSR